MMRACAFLGNRSRMASHDSVTRPTRPGPPTGLASSAADDDRTRSGSAPRSWPGRRCARPGPRRGSWPARPSERISSCGVAAAGSARAARRSRPAAAAGPRRPAWPLSMSAGIGSPEPPPIGDVVEAAGRLGPDLGVGTDGAQEVDGERAQGRRPVALTGCGLEAEAAVGAGPSSAATAWCSAWSPARARCGWSGARARPRGPTVPGRARARARPPGQELLQRVRVPASVVAQVSASRLARSSGVSSPRWSASARRCPSS